MIENIAKNAGGKNVVKAESLLRTWSLRLAMMDSKAHRPPQHVMEEIRKLVGYLNVLDPNAEIDIQIVNRDPLLMHYVLVSSGEILASLDETECN